MDEGFKGLAAPEGGAVDEELNDGAGEPEEPEAAGEEAGEGRGFEEGSREEEEEDA